jgi:hypothetical protein
MNLLYIIFTLVLDIGPNNPIGHPALPPTRPPSEHIKQTIPSLTYPKNFLDANFQTKFMGIDDRFPVGIYEPDEFIRIAQLNDYFEKLNLIQQKVKNNRFIEDVKKDPLINEILETDEIAGFQIKSGGLFDDWEMNI